jgi:drug/metabolite transporter (DMT)-like permease
MNTPAVSSTPVLRTTLVWSGIATVVLAVAGAIGGFLAGGGEGMWSALLAVVLAAVFLSLTAASILIANRWYGDPLYVPIFFGAVMGAWLVKFVVFIVVLVILRDQPWLDAPIFFVALVVSVLVSLAIDVVVMLRMRVPHASDVTLPTLGDIARQAREETRGGQTDPADGSTPRD